MVEIKITGEGATLPRQKVAYKAPAYYRQKKVAGRAVAFERMAPKVSRNEPCPCGSGLKFKHCHKTESELLQEAHRQYQDELKNQERITTQVAEYINEKLNPKGVAVTLSARHLCVEMRGVKKHDTWTTTSKLIGVFKDNPDARREFLILSKTP